MRKITTKIPWSPEVAVTLRAAVDIRENIAMKARIALDNRMRAIKQMTDDPGNSEQLRLLEEIAATIKPMEVAAEKAMTAFVSNHPMHDQMTAIRGVGSVLAARILSMIDIHKVSSVSALWKWAGMHVVDGKAARPVKGQKLDYNPRLKTSMFIFADVQIRNRGPYRDDYDRAKAEYAEKYPEKSAAHIHKMAMRKASKLFLSHLWQVWREMEGLPSDDAYILTVGRHTHKIHPHERGWPKM
ncbi:hypothetical protein [Microcystis phage Mvi-JY20]|uniref:Transposase IS116/IS110/IS902 C-terminal domain-containing protein n=1 Tax=Microcystis phage Mvi-JY20 TaxID=3128146 RepID=A0AAX4QGV4_9CAUD